MKKLLFILCLFSVACSSRSYHLSSPDGQVQVSITEKEGKIYYEVKYRNQSLIQPSSLGLSILNMPGDGENMTITQTETSSRDEYWTPVWGTVKRVRNHYNELLIHTQGESKDKRQIDIRFRAFNDGIGFRYEFPAQDTLKEIKILEEHTAFNLAGDYLAWWIQVHYDSYELLYNTSRISQIPEIISQHKTRSEGEYYMKNPSDTLIAVSTPVTMKVNDSLFISLHEAALTDYAEMVLKIDPRNPLQWKSFLVPGINKAKVTGSLPFHTPWRTIQIAVKAGDLITSHLIENLNDPCVLKDVSWIKPIKYIGIWWGYHIGKWSWMPGPKMGATTKNAMEYIDFASENGIDGLLIEGWCVDKDWGERKTFITPNPYFDLQKVVDYAKKKNVQLILHHETMGCVKEYEAQKDTAFRLLQSLGLHYVKTGYAYYIDCEKGFDPWKLKEGADIPQREFHHGQRMVKHYTDIVKLAASCQVNVCAHEPIKPTGEHRTWPNMMTREGARGQEYNAWVKAHGNPPEHNTILPFTRMLGGPMDFTPGIFDLTFDRYRKEQRVNTTLAQQLALYVVFYSPMQMAADLIENYRNHPAFKFIRDVKVTWDTTIVLNGHPGDYLTIARRSGEEWFVGSITDEEAREIVISLNFLDANKTYLAEIYADAPETNLQTAPEKYEIRTTKVKAADTLTMKLCNGGGQAIHLIPLQ